MPIQFNEKTREFHIFNNHISYIIGILKNGDIEQCYFGKKLRSREGITKRFYQFGPSNAAICPIDSDILFTPTVQRREYPNYGTGDYHFCAYQTEQSNGSRINNFSYRDYCIHKGKDKIPGMPATYGDDVTTLELYMHDETSQTDITLFYHIFDNLPVITRSVRFTQVGDQSINITRALSFCLDLPDSEYEMITLNGAWGRERYIDCSPLHQGIQEVNSNRGISSSEHNPFIALKRKDTNEDNGEAFGFSLLYSGNFTALAEVDSYDKTRVAMGINPFEFSWKLNTGENFYTPEAVLVYSDEGLGGMSQALHSLCQNNIMRGDYKLTRRPVLFNNWEATYFNFDEEKLLKIASSAKELGAELFVLDDGWFGKRDDDTTSLGDWFTDLNKLPNGIGSLGKKVKDLGLKFGLWIEPEMVNEKSKLFREHPDWAIGVPNRKRSYGRHQFVLDFSNPDVIDYIFNLISKVFEESKVDYVKWDMNRYLSDIYSPTLPPNRQKEFFHRYILGFYNLYERFIEKFPHVLFESCASGGSRFDLGLMYYAPQAWTSDDTDGVERLKIQYGTSLIYPIVSMGSHVSAVPNHQILRSTSIDFRANVAMFGAFGYELDPTILSDYDKLKVSQQIAFFKEYGQLFQYGTFIRLKSPFENNNDCAWMVVSEDKKTAIVANFKVLARPNTIKDMIRLKGLNPNFDYATESFVFGGDELMNIGFPLQLEFNEFPQNADQNNSYSHSNNKGDFFSELIVLKAK